MLTASSMSLFAGLLAGILGCQKKEDKPATGTASVAFANGTALGLQDACVGTSFGSGTLCYKPSVLGLKMLNAYIVEDIGPDQNNIGEHGGSIWINPECPVSVSEDDGKSSTNCSDEVVTKYFDFARDTAAVNTELNSQGLSVLAGTYNYIRIDFCIGGAKSNNVQFEAEGMDEPYQTKIGGCGVTSVKAVPPVTIPEDGSVKITLTYDLSTAIYGNDSNSTFGMGGGANDICWKHSDGEKIRCYNPPQFIPSIQ